MALLTTVWSTDEDLYVRSLTDFPLLTAALVLGSPECLGSRMAFRWAALRAAERLGWVDSLRFRVGRWDAFSPDCEEEFDRLRTIGVLDFATGCGRQFSLTPDGLRYLERIAIPDGVTEAATAASAIPR